MTIQKLTALLFASLLLFAGCAKIPQESVELSIALGNQIATLEKAHLALLDSFFSEKERQIDQFLKDQWAPEFNQTFFSNTQIVGKWQEVSTSNDPADRTAFLNWVGPVLQQKIFEKRQQLLGPLTETERQLRRQLQESYLQAFNMNDSLTQLLSTAATVQNKQQHYQRLLGIDASKVSEGLGRVDTAISQLLGTAGAISNQVEQTETYLQTLRELTQHISGKGGN